LARRESPAIKQGRKHGRSRGFTKQTGNLGDERACGHALNIAHDRSRLPGNTSMPVEARGIRRRTPDLVLMECCSLAFWRNIIGFGIAYERPEERFVYLDNPEGQQVMLCQRHGRFETGSMQSPLGQGVIFQIYFRDITSILSALRACDWPTYLGPYEVWRKVVTARPPSRRCLACRLQLLHSAGHRDDRWLPNAAADDRSLLCGDAGPQPAARQSDLRFVAGAGLPGPAERSRLRCYSSGKCTSRKYPLIINRVPAIASIPLKWTSG